MLILCHLLLRSNGFVRAAQGRGQRPQVLVALGPPKILLRGQAGARHPAQHHIGIAPAADIAGPFAHPRLRALDEVGGGQAAMQAGRQARLEWEAEERGKSEERRKTGTQEFKIPDARFQRKHHGNGTHES